MFILYETGESEQTLTGIKKLPRPGWVMLADNATDTTIIIIIIELNCLLFSLYHGRKRFGSLGNSEARRMFFKSKKNMSTLSKPIPPPA